MNNTNMIDDIAIAIAMNTRNTDIDDTIKFISNALHCVADIVACGSEMDHITIMNYKNSLLRKVGVIDSNDIKREIKKLSIVSPGLKGSDREQSLSR